MTLKEEIIKILIQEEHNTGRQIEMFLGLFKETLKKERTELVRDVKEVIDRTQFIDDGTEFTNGWKEAVEIITEDLKLRGLWISDTETN